MSLENSIDQAQLQSATDRAVSQANQRKQAQMFQQMVLKKLEQIEKKIDKLAKGEK